VSDVQTATEESIAAAAHLGPMDAGAVEALRVLAARSTIRLRASSTT
jgi:hypothetical protein